MWANKSGLPTHSIQYLTQHVLRNAPVQLEDATRPFMAHENGLSRSN